MSRARTSFRSRDAGIRLERRPERSSLLAAPRLVSAERHSLVGPERRELVQGHSRFVFGAVRDERLRAVGRIGPLEGMPLELRVHEDSPQVGMPAKTNAAHVPRLALEPVHAGPNRGHAVELGPVRVFIPDASLETNPMPQRHRVKMHHDLEPRCSSRIVDRAKIDGHVEIERRVFAQEGAHALPLARLDHRGLVAEARVRLEDGGAKTLLQLLEDSLAHEVPPFAIRSALASSSLIAGRRSRGSAAERRRWTRSSALCAGSNRGLTTPGRRSFRAILSCSSIRPSSTASGRGGQPGMYTSTGMILSMPGTVV